MIKVHQRLNKMNRENRLLYKKELRRAMAYCEKLGNALEDCINHMEIVHEAERQDRHTLQHDFVGDVWLSLHKELSFIERWEKEKAGYKKCRKK